MSKPSSEKDSTKSPQSKIVSAGSQSAAANESKSLTTVPDKQKNTDTIDSSKTDIVPNAWSSYGEPTSLASPSSVTMHNLESRETWTHHLDFILSSLGFAVGLGNVWRYPYLAFKNGGAAFIIPYLVSVLLAGMPLYGIEGFLGQLSGLGASEAYYCLAPLFQGVGWAMISMSYMVSLYYNMVIAWSLYYLSQSFYSTLPYASCQNEWNSDDCYSHCDDVMCAQNFSKDFRFYKNECVNRSSINDSQPGVSSADEYFYKHVLNFVGDEEIGEISWRIALSLFVAWLLVFGCIAGGVKFSGKIVYFTSLFPYVMLIIFLCYGVTLPGSGEGIKYYLLPDFTKLAQFEVWKDAAVQVFFSLNPAMGGIVTMCSYNKFHNNLARDTILICILDSLTSMLAGCSVFASMGYLAHELNKTVDQATQSHLGLVFIAFPETISRMPVPHLWSVLFFVMLVTLGLDSQFVLFETTVTALTDRFKRLRKPKCRLSLVAGGCVLSYLIGLLFCTQGGVYFFMLFDDHSAGYCTLIVGFLESLLIAYVYGVNNFIDDIALSIGYKLGWYWKIVWLVTCPAYMLGLFICFLYYYAPSEFRGQVMSQTKQGFGWGMSVIAAVILLSFPIYQVIKNRMKKRRWISLVLPTQGWIPKQRHELALAVKAAGKANGEKSSLNEKSRRKKDKNM